VTPQRLGRIAGLFYALNFILGILSLVWLKQGRIAASEQLTVAAASEYAIVILLLARLFDPAGRALSWAVAAIGILGCTLSAAGPLHLFTSPVNALAVFGLYCTGLGTLIVLSRLMPTIIGALLMVGGFAWLTFASPTLANSVAPYNMAAGAIAELIFTLYLILFGVRAAPNVASTPASLAA
jgi:hypothetical protein